MLRRYLRGSHVSWVQSCRLVRADHTGELLWLPIGAGFAHRVRPDGSVVRAAPVAEFGSGELVRGSWRGADVLILMPTDAAHSIWWFFVDGVFDGWYVNLEQRSPLWVRDGRFGVDVIDHELDIVVRPDRSWLWKDEDDLVAVTGLPGYWDAEGAASIRIEGERVLAAVETGAFPFDGSWCDFEADPSWPLPVLGEVAETAEDAGPAE